MLHRPKQNSSAGCYDFKQEFKRKKRKKKANAAKERKFRIFSPRLFRGRGRQLQSPQGERAGRLPAEASRHQLLDLLGLLSRIAGFGNESVPFASSSPLPDSPNPSRTLETPGFLRGPGDRDRAPVRSAAGLLRGGLCIQINSLREQQRHPSLHPTPQKPQGFRRPKSETQTATLSQPHPLPEQQPLSPQPRLRAF